MNLKEKQELIKLAKLFADPNNGDWAELYFPDSDSPIIINPEIMIEDIKNK